MPLKSPEKSNVAFMSPDVEATLLLRLSKAFKGVLRGRFLNALQSHIHHVTCVASFLVFSNFEAPPMFSGDMMNTASQCKKNPRGGSAKNSIA